MSGDARCGLRSHFASGLLFALFQVALFLPLLTGGDVFLSVSPRLAPPWSRAGEPPARPQDGGGSDKVVFTLPNLVHLSRVADGGDASIFWNPSLLCGYPFMATQDTFALYPLNVIFLLVDPVDGFLLSAIVHGWLACFLAWLVLLRLDMGPSAARLGATVFGASGWFLAHLDVVNFTQAAAWVPLMIWGSLECMGDRRFRGVLALATGFLLSFLGGMAQITFIGLFVAGCVTLVLGIRHLLSRAPWKALKGWGLALVAVLVGVMLAAPQLLPTLEFQERSGRSRTSADALAAQSMRGLELTGLVAPELLGSPPEFDRLHRLDQRYIPAGVTEQNFPLARTAGLPQSGASLMERVFYPGAGALFLFALALFAHRRRQALIAWGIFVAGILAAMHTPVQWVLTELPFFAFGNPRRFLFVAVMGLAYGSAVGLRAFQERRLPVRGLWTLAIALLAPAALGCVLLFAGSTEESALMSDDSLRRWMLQKSACGCAVFVATGLLLLLCNRYPRAAVLLPACILALQAADLGYLHHRISPGQPRGEAGFASAVGTWLRESTSSKAGRLVRYREPSRSVSAIAPLPPNTSLTSGGIRDLQGYEGIVDRRLEELLDLVQPGIALEHHLIREITDPERLQSPILDLAGARYVLTSSPLDLPRIYVNLQEQVAVHERGSSLERIRPITRMHLVADDAEALRVLGGSDFDAKRDLVVTSSDAAVLLASIGEDPRKLEEVHLIPGPAAELEVLQDRSTRIQIRYASPKPFIFHVADTWDPNWEAMLEDGQSLPVVRVNHAFRAIPVPAGVGVVTLEYVPHAFKRGLVLAGAGLFLLCVWGILLLRRTRRKPG